MVTINCYFFYAIKFSYFETTLGLEVMYKELSRNKLGIDWLQYVNVVTSRGFVCGFSYLISPSSRLDVIILWDNRASYEIMLQTLVVTRPKLSYGPMMRIWDLNLKVNSARTEWNWQVTTHFPRRFLYKYIMAIGANWEGYKCAIKAINARKGKFYWGSGK